MKTTIDLNDLQVAFAYKSDRELKRTLFIFKLIRHPRMVRFLTKVALWIIRFKLPFRFLLKKTVFRVFCAGENRTEAQRTMNNLASHKVHTVLDYVAEGDKTDEGFEKNLQIILANIRFVAAANNEAFVGVKLSGLEDVVFIENVRITPGEKPELNDLRMKRFVERVETICVEASGSNVKVYFDAEERSTQDVYDAVVEMMMRKYNKNSAWIYNTLQMYLKDRLAYLEYLIEDAGKHSYSPGIKLVRGAYVEKERLKAQNEHRISPVHETKAATDRAFDKAVELCLTHHALVCTCLATHNQKSIEYAISLIRDLAIKDHYKKVFFSQLFGMSDHLTFNLARAHFNSSKYVPYGEVEKAIPYLLRRAEENSSVEGQALREYELLLKEKDRRNL